VYWQLMVTNYPVTILQEPEVVEEDLHAENEWGISLVDDDVDDFPEPPSQPNRNASLPTGLQVEFLIL